MTKKDYIEQLAEEAAANNGVVHIPHTPPKSTTPEETDKLINELKQEPGDYLSMIDEISIYVSILNESNGALSPFIYKEIEERNKANTGTPITLWSFMEDVTRKDPEALEILEAAREKLKHAKKIERVTEANKKQQTDLAQLHEVAAPRIKYNNSDSFIFSKDNFTNSVFSATTDIVMEKGKPVLYATFRNKDRKKQKVNLKAFFSFDREYMKKYGIDDASIDPGYDRAVCMVCDNLYYNGNTRVTLSKILEELHITYSQKEAEKLLLTLRKLKSINIVVDNTEVLKLYGINKKGTRIDGLFLPIRLTDDPLLIRGNIAKLTVTIYDFTPFWQVATPIEQQTSYTKEIFSLYEGRRTSKYWRTIIQLMHEISYLRSGRRSSKFIISSICKSVGDTDSRQRESTTKLVFELLDSVFIPLDYITSYETDENRTFFIASYHKDRQPQKRLEGSKSAVNKKFK